MTNVVLFILFFFTAVVSCRHETLAPQPGTNDNRPNTGGSSGAACNPDTIYFQQQVLPILISNCTLSGCHDEMSRRKGVVLTSYANVLNTAGIRPGNPLDSDLYEALVEDDPEDRMPKSPLAPLTAQQKAAIFKWIQQGAKNLSCENSCTTSAPATFQATVQPLLSTKCAGCHSGPNAQAGIDLSTYSGVKVTISDGRFWGAVNHQPGFSAMPKNGTRLSDCELGQIKKWIDAGAINN